MYQGLQSSGRRSKKVCGKENFKKEFVLQLIEERDCAEDFEHGGNQHDVPGGVGGWQQGESEDHRGVSPGAGLAR